MQGTSSDHDRRSALNRSLRSLFRALQDRPLPDGLRALAEQLDDGEPTMLKQAG